MQILIKNLMNKINVNIYFELSLKTQKATKIRKVTKCQ